MKFSHETKKYVETVAAEALNAFEKVSTAAKQSLHVPPTPASNAFASINTLTSAAAMREYDEISRASREAREILSREPAVARVIAEDDQGQLRTIYICRTTPIQVIHQFASYRAPLGRLASLRIGSSITLPNGKHYKLLQKALLFPTELKEGWDSEDTILSSEDIRTLTVESLRAVLATTAEVPEQDLVEQLLAVERAQMNLIEGVRRRVIKKMALRDQPVLDQFQDEIFRLPLNNRLLILGPAGTGKTTTLIKRLGQKLDQESLDEDDKELVATIRQSTTTPHSQSWGMFTPTELLKQYLKEAFAKEGIAASDQRIKTWQEIRHDLARNIFGVLKAGSGSGSLVMKESLQSITQSAIVDSTHWFEDFDHWQRSAFLDRLPSVPTSLRHLQ
jgi:flagellar biosynthesis GTPase FlhF